MARRPLQSLRLVSSGLDHPECVAVAADGTLFAGGEAGQVYEIGATGTPRQLASVDGFVAGLCLDGSNRLYVCVPGAHRLVRIGLDGVTADYGAFPSGARLHEPNFPLFDGSGHLYFTDSGTFGKRDGCIWRVTPDGCAEIFDDRVRDYPNGLALDARQRSLFVVESNSGRLVRIRILPSGRAGPIEEVAHFRRAVPDGIAMGEREVVFVACYRPDRIYTVSHGGRIAVLLDDWQGQRLRAPTNVAFYGSGLRQLAIASLGGREIWALDDVGPGLPYSYPVLP